MKLNEKQKRNIGTFIIAFILILYGYVLGYISRMNHEIDEESKKIERTSKEIDDKITKIRKDGFFLDRDEF